ncbi:hypothetical protein TWF694_002118 [Orbilia ellipsospora]|uniref:F-box domain-containing protein n=1 Tax=Orbilia ellipsospora TaxID=2528407 RepID=A0AAV9X4L7_9PEZI
MSVIASLPVELQEQVLLNLSWDDHFRCAYVCKTWRTIILSNARIKNGWYLASACSSADSYIHRIFTTTGVECVYTAEGFRLLLPARNSSSGRLHLKPDSPLFNEFLFKPPLPGSKSQEVAYGLYLLGIPLCGDQMMRVPWEYVEGASVDSGYLRVSIRNFLQWLAELMGPEPGIPLEEGEEYRFHFWCNQDLPWMIGLVPQTSGLEE